MVTAIVLVRKPESAAPAPVVAAPSAPKSGHASPVITIASPQTAPPAVPEPAVVAGVADPGPASTTPVTASTSAPAPAGPIEVPDLTLGPAQPAEPAATGIGGPAPEAGQSTAILTWLSTLRITGIRPAGADSKVLMNDRVYRLNAVVDYSLGLKLTGVAVQKLTFVDEKGVVYVKEF